MSSSTESIPISPLDMDIWGEIVGHLEVDFKRDKSREISVKRKALLHIALLSSAFSELGLNALWKHMTTLEPILLSCTDFQGLETVVFLTGWHNGNWRAINSITSEQRNKMNSYLSRIRHFKPFLFDESRMREATLWPLLFGLLGCLQVLLPNLRSLEILLSEGSGWAWGHHIFPLLSSSLTHVDFKVLGFSGSPMDLGVCGTHRRDFEHILTMLDARSIGLSRVEYQGHPSTKVFDLISQFAGLKRLSLRPANSGSTIRDPDIPQSSHVLLPGLLGHFPVLECLKVDLDMFSGLPFAEPIQTSTFPSMLKRIHILGSCNDLRHFFRRCRMNLLSITSLKITVTNFPDPQPFWIDCLTSAFLMFPNIKELYIGSQSSGDQLQTDLINADAMEHILSKSITSFVIKDTLHSLDLHGLWRMANSWPHIRRLKLGRYAIRCYAPCLIIFSSHLPFLEELEIPINSMSLITLMIPSDHISISPLHKIKFTYLNHTPDLNFEEKIVFVDKLMLLFPKLKLIQDNPVLGWQFHKFHTDLQMLITLCHGSYMHRWAFLQRNNAA